MAEATDELLISTYIHYRDMIREKEAQCKADVAEIEEQMDTIEAAMLRRLNRRGANNTNTDAGTAYKKASSTVRMIDRAAFLDYVKKNKAWDLITNHVSKDAVDTIIDTKGTPPPGIHVTRKIKVIFNR